MYPEIIKQLGGCVEDVIVKLFCLVVFLAVCLLVALGVIAYLVFK